ncbi:uncharacterized protein MELLADRAFT_123329 [Melampsora larici-populina 98AG31]|uniref:Secreted protein n=1 Tax=Melampsora larici-populina (strain 98AG31 / pathotype 3-4-7) TaxID=747676 RepID=F4S357_MELLP|nr:uncharacterized protein MELLADRAFT_123329 [Melampsora larici-populina 98AG31]EGG00966.1 secreted protein [Melampsora larici-populina 98AG31]
MLSFQSPKLFIVFIGICITQFAFSNADIARCKTSYQSQRPSLTSVCEDDYARKYACVTTTCDNSGRQFVPMKGCLHNGAGGQSEQQCSGYKPGKDGHYECTNSGGQTYQCPYSLLNVPFITCGDCYLP